MTIIGAIIGILLGALFSGFVIWLVAKLNLGLEVDGFGPAYIGAIIIAVVSWLLLWLMSTLGITIRGRLPRGHRSPDRCGGCADDQRQHRHGAAREGIQRRARRGRSVGRRRLASGAAVGRHHSGVDRPGT